MALDEKRDLTFDENVRESASIRSEVQQEGGVSLEERRLVRKLDRRILPIACFMYLFACPYFGDSMLSFLAYCHDIRLGQKQPG
jgi:hypothetical protein